MASSSTTTLPKETLHKFFFFRLGNWCASTGLDAHSSSVDKEGTLDARSSSADKECAHAVSPERIFSLWKTMYMDQMCSLMYITYLMSFSYNCVTSYLL